MLAACGGGGELSREEFVSEANAVCGRVNDELNEIQEPANLSEIAETLDEGLVVVRDGIADVRELDPPDEMSDDVDAWLAKVEESADELEKARDGAERNDQAAVGIALQSADDANTEANRLAARMALTACAED